MSYDLSLKEEMLKSHTWDVYSLKNYLQNKNLLNTIAGNHLGKTFEIIEELIIKYLNESQRNEEKNKEIEELKTRLQQVKQEIEDAKKSEAPVATQIQPVIQFVPYTNSQPGINIKSEIILTAGPRKDTTGNDTELGEDVAGLVSLQEETFFWLLDGTSDSAAITGNDGDNGHEASHIFSSRLLAQSVGHYIQKHIHRCFNGQIPLEQLLQEANEHISNEWVKRINNELPEKKGSILQMIHKGFQLICSTTVIMGRLLNNGHLYALRTGDSKIFPFKQVNGQTVLDREFKFTADPKEEHDRIAFRLAYDETTTSFVIDRNKPRWRTETAEDIHIAFAFSDGIGRITEAQLASNNPGIVEAIRQNMGRIPQKTFDDKSLIILERVSSNH
jgi:hypothetical protein